MSAFAGIFHFDEQPVERELLYSFGHALSIQNPDGGYEVFTDSVGMVYRGFPTNKHSLNEVQPHASGSGTIICWDGRLDNREDLLAGCRLIDAELTDVEIVSASYDAHGPKFLKSLVGDFALALWDVATRTLMLARDAIGPRPLYYCKRDNAIIFCSSLSVLADLSQITIEVNDDYVAGHLTRGVEPHLTPYLGIFAVPPGHVTVCCNGRVSTERYWKLNPNNVISYASERCLLYTSPSPRDS